MAENETRRPSPLSKYSGQIGRVIAASLALVTAGWLVTLGACYWDLVCFDGIYILATLGAILFVLLPVGLAYRNKAIRAARGRLPLQPITGLNFSTFAKDTVDIFKTKNVPMLDEEDRGWRVPFSDGDVTVYVNVYKMELYRWLMRAYINQKWMGKKSAISRRSNKSLDRLQWQARIELLKKANAVYRNSNSANSTIYLKIFDDKEPVESAWYIVDELLEEVEESGKIW
jgi:hypothetical protein